MSLTTIIKDARIKELIRRYFSFKTFDIGAEIKAPPITKHYTTIGIAFDYLARWWLERKYGATVTKSWVAEHGAGKIMLRCGTHVSVRAGKTITYVPVEKLDSIRRGDVDRITRYVDPDPNLKPLALMAVAIITESRAAYNDWLRTGIVTDELLRCSLKLVGLDAAFRANVFDWFDAEISNDSVDELRSLWTVMESGDLAELEEPILPNPTFGKASRMVGGADIDIVAGNTLIDIKTTKKQKFERQYFEQLAGYYALSIIGGIEGTDRFPAGKPSIDKIGIYFSRHGKLCTFSVGGLVDGDLGEFVSDFESLSREIMAANKTCTVTVRYKSSLDSRQP